MYTLNAFLISADSLETTPRSSFAVFQFLIALMNSFSFIDDMITGYVKIQIIYLFANIERL